MLALVVLTLTLGALLVGVVVGKAIGLEYRKQALELTQAREKLAMALCDLLAVQRELQRLQAPNDHTELREMNRDPRLYNL